MVNDVAFTPGAEEMTEPVLLKGKKIGDQIRAAMCEEITALKERYGSVPKIVAISVGEDHASHLYLKHQSKTAEKVGVQHEVLQFGNDIKDEDLQAALRKLNEDESVNGIIIQMPMPKQINVGKLLETLDPAKDVEGIHADNLGLLVLKKAKLVPCTALSALELILSADIDLYGREVVVVGSSKIVGRPLSLMLMDKGATVTVCDIGTSERGLLESHVKRAEVLVVAVGKAGLIPGEWIREESLVIDIGINHVDGKIVGDVDFESACKKAKYITPVPGGVGPLTVTMLMRNALKAYKMQKGI